MSEVAAELEALLPAIEAWLADDPDPQTRAETLELLHAAAARPEAGAELIDRFSTRLQFGTAGLRGALGAGPNRMNRLIVRIAAAGVGRYLLERVPDAKGRGVVVGYDARHKSDQFAADTARVLASMGIRAFVFPHVVPTPVLAFSITHLRTAAGIQVTASHNPPADNGYKVYLGDGAQITPPADHDISSQIDAVLQGPLATLSLPPTDEGENDSLVSPVAPEVLEAYLTGAAALDPHRSTPASRRQLTIVYTAMHGVGWSTTHAVLHRAGFSGVHAVVAQRDPDPDFPTVAFPNPEEPGALDLAFADAHRVNADLVLANDPDADRLAVAINDRGRWRALRGDEVGWLLADHLLTGSRGAPAVGDGLGDGRKPLVATTVVSSSLLRSMAAEHDAEYVETLTGFKWLARAALDRPTLRPVLAYEEALGYGVGELVRDKDGITAALVFADLAASLLERGESIVDRLDAIAARYGRHRTDQWSIRFDGAGASEKMAALMSRVRASRLTALAGVPVTRVRDLAAATPPGDVVIFDLGPLERPVARVVVRPSGTEPKAKVYFETIERDGDGDPPPAIEALRTELAAALGL